jgi:hypothetical protein
MERVMLRLLSWERVSLRRGEGGRANYRCFGDGGVGINYVLAVEYVRKDHDGGIDTVCGCGG